MRQKVQIVLFLGMVVAAIRLAWILYERHQDSVQTTKQQSAPLNPDYYVVPKKLYPYDLKSAKQLTRQPVWVREGYHHTYYPYDSAGAHTDFSREAGMLLPLQKLRVKDVVTDTAPHSAHIRQIMAVFEQEGKPFALSIGSVTGNSYSIYSDDYFFIEDPHQ